MGYVRDRNLSCTWADFTFLIVYFKNPVFVGGRRILLIVRIKADILRIHKPNFFRRIIIIK